MKDLKTTSAFVPAVMYIREFFGELSNNKKKKKKNSEEKPDGSNQPAPDPSLPKNRFIFPLSFP